MQRYFTDQAPIWRWLLGVVAACFLYATAASASQQVYYSFQGGAQGANPESLLLGRDGNIYGITQNGGASGNGVVFQLTPQLKYSVFANLDQPGFSAAAYSPLVQDANGYFYLTQTDGGTSQNGRILQISPSGVITTLYNFSGKGDGGTPLAKLSIANDGKLYGITANGGATNQGTIFRFDQTQGTLTTLVSLNAATGYIGIGIAGLNEDASLLAASDGYLYGVTNLGGAYRSGTIFKLNPQKNGAVSVLFSFPNEFNNYGFRSSGLVEGPDGNFYGVGISFYYGTSSIFKVTRSGVYTPLSSLDKASCVNPFATLIADKLGNLYGICQTNPANLSYGTVFQFTPNYQFKQIANLTDVNPGLNLIQAADGSIFVTDLSNQVNGTGPGDIIKITGTQPAPPVFLVYSLGNPAPGQIIASWNRVFGASSYQNACRHLTRRRGSNTYRPGNGANSNDWPVPFGEGLLLHSSVLRCNRRMR